MEEKKEEVEKNLDFEKEDLQLAAKKRKTRMRNLSILVIIAFLSVFVFPSNMSSIKDYYTRMNEWVKIHKYPDMEHEILDGVTVHIPEAVFPEGHLIYGQILDYKAVMNILSDKDIMGVPVFAFAFNGNTEEMIFRKSVEMRINLTQLTVSEVQYESLSLFRLDHEGKMKTMKIVIEGDWLTFSSDRSGIFMLVAVDTI